MFLKYWKVILILFLLAMLVSCVSSLRASNIIQITIIDDQIKKEIPVKSGITVLQVLASAGQTLGNLDRTDPPSYTILNNSSIINIIRVKEEFSVQDIEIPFLRQNIKNESLLLGEERLIQPGKNGLKQVTYRRLYENDVQISETIFSQTIITEQVPEIIMVGVNKPFSPVPIPGSLVYLIAGNAWMMKSSTSLRSPVVSSGDLDGYIFSISYDRKWLLYTRKIVAKPSEINSLWVVSLEKNNPTPIDLGVSNVINHAAWVPGESNTITYSTVEPVSTAPGWQANNNLFVLSFSDGGSIWRNDKVLDTNGGGQYGWWGTSYFWSPDGSTLTYSRPDSIGYVDFKNQTLVRTKEILPFSTQSNWAWVSQLGWSPNSKEIFFSDHLKSDQVSIEESSPEFSLSAILESDSTVLELSQNDGMFSNPVPAAITEYGHYQVAAYRAINPSQSNSSKYQLFIMDRDGSNSHLVFPPSGSAGMDPKRICWAPDHPSGQPYYLAVMYEGNIWLIDSISGVSYQVTGDGLIDSIDWK